MQLARQRHRGQTDRAGVDYFKGHLMSVYKIARKMSKDENVHLVALLHDILEDTPTSYNELVDLFGETVADAVLTVTKKGDDYSSYINQIKSNPIARIVKIADMTHNSDLSRLQNPNEEDLERRKKYLKYISVLS